ncbi:kinase-like domain-containing protein [Lentinula guzmanii]|uniref:Kinase-like domain-containing protein n=1 Tax=Lentinula guzmanii TaxID=2804957 RepID=A0AA38J7D5_9AGAR|nr:kinase-like domain-containing protein [Lentinula guzmanii]
MIPAARLQNELTLLSSRRIMVNKTRRGFLNLYRGSVFQLLDGTVVKIGGLGYLQREFEATQYARKHTMLPIPRVYDLFTSKDNQVAYLIMEYVPGEMLLRKWRFLSASQKHSIMVQVKDIITEMRSIRPPQSQRWIGSFTGGPFLDFLIGGNDPYGPFDNEIAFNNFRISRFTSMPYCEFPSVRERFASIRREMPNDHDIVFTHGDINLRNILVDFKRDDVRIVALVDWEQAGWRPAYWEKAKLVFGAQPPDWYTAAETWIIEGYENEIDREIELQLIHGGTM